jgi:hypothetical protein
MSLNSIALMCSRLIWHEYSWIKNVIYLVLKNRASHVSITIQSSKYFGWFLFLYASLVHLQVLEIRWYLSNCILCRAEEPTERSVR